MAKQKVKATLEVETELRNTGVTPEYWLDDDFIGYLHIGKATLTWKPKGGKIAVGKKTWEQLIEWLRS